MSSGKIVQVVGPVVDVGFSVDQTLPDINNALIVYKNNEEKTKVVLELLKVVEAVKPFSIAA